MKAIHIYVYVMSLMSFYSLALVSEARDAGEYENVRDSCMIMLSQNEADFENEPLRCMQANKKILDELAVAALSREIASLDTATASADEIARIAFLRIAFSDDYAPALELCLKAASRGSAVCNNYMGVLFYYDGKMDLAQAFIQCAMNLNSWYLPAIYNAAILFTVSNSTPDEEAMRRIKILADSFYKLLSSQCDPDKQYSVPPYTMMEIISIPRVKNYEKNRRNHLRGCSLLRHIRKVIPEYEPPVKFKGEYNYW